MTEADWKLLSGQGGWDGVGMRDDKGTQGTGDVIDLSVILTGDGFRSMCKC